MNDTQWFDNTRIYHLLIDRFNGGWTTPPANVNDFCGGTLQGVADKLDYIKNLGYTAVMLSPVFVTQNFHGYHTLDYDNIDPHFGTWDDLQNLINKAHNMGMRIICDFVPNHCFFWCKTFQEALFSNQGIHRDWFLFPKEESDDYVSFLMLPDLPKFNLENPEAARFMISKAERLAKMGVDGFRIDHALGQPFSFLKKLRQALKEIRKEIVIFGEVWAEGIPKYLHTQLYFKTMDRLRDFYSPDFGRTAVSQDSLQADYVNVLDGVLDFTYRQILLDEIHAGRRFKGNQELNRKLAEHFSRYPSDFKLVLFLDNHDTDRFLFDCHNDETLLQEAIDLSKQLAHPFSLLYGTEQLMTTETSIFGGEEYADLRVRACMDWSGKK